MFKERTIHLYSQQHLAVVIVKSWKQPKHLATCEWMKQTVVYVHNTLQLCSKNEPPID